MGKDKKIRKIVEEVVNRDMTVKFTDTARKWLKSRSGEYERDMSETLGVALYLTQEVNNDSISDLVYGKENDDETKEAAVDWITDLIDEFGVSEEVLRSLVD